MSNEMVKELNSIYDNVEKRLAALNGNADKEYTFWVYDVWGNAEDGYTVNDRQNTKVTITLSDSDSDEDILNLLEENNLINRENTETTFSIDGISDDETIEINIGDDEKPFGQLVKEDDDYTTDIGTFLSEDVLEIKREQYMSGRDGWTTSFYTLVLGTGGPHTEFTTNGLICVYWGGDKLESTTHNDDAISAIEQIEEYLNETSNN